MADRTEYQVEYCHMGGKNKKGGGGGGKGEGEGMVMCQNNEDIQPVGGRVHHAYVMKKQQEAEEAAKLAREQALKNGCPANLGRQASTPYGHGGCTYGGGFVAHHDWRNYMYRF